MKRPEIEEIQENIKDDLRYNLTEYEIEQHQLCNSVCDYALDLEARLKEAEEVLNQIFNLGHNNDCIFCGLKDKEVLKGLGKEI